MTKSLIKSILERRESILSESKDKSNPQNRKEGSKNIVDIYAEETPGQEVPVDGIKEEVENIEEISTTILKSYKKKAEKSAQKNWEKADKEEDKAMSTDGEKYPDKQKRHIENAAKFIHNWKKRQAGITTANGKMNNLGYVKVPSSKLKEEVENIEESSFSAKDADLGGILKHHIDDDNRMHMTKEHGVYLIRGFKKGKHFFDNSAGSKHSDALKKFNQHKKEMNG